MECLGTVLACSSQEWFEDHVLWSGADAPNLRSVAKKRICASQKERQEPLVASLLLVAMPGAPSSVLALSSDARSP